MSGILSCKIEHVQSFWKHISCMLLFTALMFNSEAQTQKQFLDAGNQSFENGDYFEAIHHFEQALKFKANEQAQYLIAMSYYELKEYEKASTHFAKAPYGEQYPFTKFYLAYCEKLLGNYLTSIKHFQDFTANYREDDFYRKKATQEIASCYWAIDQKEDTKAAINHFDKPVNTPFSDFGAQYLYDTILMLSALVPKDPKDLKSEFISNIYFFEESEKGWKKSTLIAPVVEGYTHTANGFFLQEKEQLFFTACNNYLNEVRCDIFVAFRANQQWNKIQKLNINDSIATNTQPTAYVNESGKTILYFVSNKDSEIGKNNLYTAEEIEYGNFSTPTLLPSIINTIDNESTPFFDKENNTLYFSSEWHYGFGGYDIFASEWKNNQWQKPVNLGMPVNSSAHDQYFYKTEENKALFSSNRDGALQLRGAACCYDIFEYILPKEEDDETELITLLTDDDLENDDATNNLTSKTSDKPNKNTGTDNGKTTSEKLFPGIDEDDILSGKLTPIQLLEKMLPAIVYFHNDEPEPRTTKTVTQLSYDVSYQSYVNVRDDFYVFYPDKNALDDFFKNKVDQGYKDLQKFAQQLEVALKTYRIELTIEGYCSPLALNDYNVNLAKRRIVNLQNFLLNWNDGALRNYFNQGYLTFKDAPFGEEKSPDGISDRLDELEKSVYSPKASLERRVAIIAVAAK
jgi:tetratricopeptide (TPR) repeat protein